MPTTLRGPDGRFARMNERGQLVDADGGRRISAGRRYARTIWNRSNNPVVHTYWRRDECCGWAVDEWDDGSSFIDGQWMAEPGDYDYTTCEHCGEWVHYDDTTYSEYDEVYYCSRHASRARNYPDYDDDDGYYDEDDYDRGSSRSTSRPRCAVCNSSVSEVTHHHPVLDRVACDACGPTTEGYEVIAAFELVAA